MIAVNGNTRAPIAGRLIVAPCGHQQKVYHFSWAALRCLGCDAWHDKNEYVTQVNR